MKNSLCIISVALSIFVPSKFSLAQGTITALNTGGTQPIITEIRSLYVDAGLTLARLGFDVGFASGETNAAAAFLDSFTVTVQDTNAVNTVILLTEDASGTTFAPPTPGTIVVSPSSIDSNLIVYPSLSPVLLNRQAYRISALIPSQFFGGQINVYFDLFDNLNGVHSQGWFTSPSVYGVPEPQLVSFLGLAGLILFGSKLINKG
jgi:hypothetical protein